LLADIASSEPITAENKNAKGVGREGFPTIVLGRRKGKVATKKSKKEGMQEFERISTQTQGSSQETKL
jgi:hypothetical protein